MGRAADILSALGAWLSHRVFAVAAGFVAPVARFDWQAHECC